MMHAMLSNVIESTPNWQTSQSEKVLNSISATQMHFLQGDGKDMEDWLA